ncbi:coenzyme Q-binding protein COQ10 [Candidatus Liberibacter solanacearum]|uniref:type II toxin-antitoxin system RatA family toxin n=1 Tax=Candidatus Liberibacter solanacearum TaxID=556287 RepID=UPI003870F634
MHHFTADRIVNYSSKQMFDLVADVEKYPEFVPLCKELVIHESEQRGSDKILIASMKISYVGIQETFVTRVQIDEHQNRISVRHLKNLFNSLENDWYFEEISGSECIVRFSIKYELQNRLFDKMLRAIFEPVFSAFVKAFERRAKKIYFPLSLENKKFTEK